MLVKTLLHTFLDFNYQANAKILDALAALTPAQMQKETALSHGNALELIRHMADTEWSWRLYTGEGTGGKYLWDVEDVSDLAKLAAFWGRERERMLRYLDALSEDALAEVIELSPTFQVPRWQIFLHLVNHSTHHRSELSRYLTECGSPVTEGEIEFIRFGMDIGEK